MPAAVSSLAPSATGFKVPANLSLPVPPKPPSFTPAKPSSERRASTVTPGTHPAFFAGEASLGSGAYYLALPNGNVFGYYSYLTDPRYVYHFDMGYEYVVDANDGQGGIYFYDFTTQHWLYTGRNYPFPYVYDFSLSAVLYYYPSASGAGHYTTSPRVFHNFATGSDITPDQNPDLLLQPNTLQFWQALSYGNGAGHCTNGPSTYCVSPNDLAGTGFQYDILPHQRGGYQGPWSFQTTDATVAQGYNCPANDQANGRFLCSYPSIGLAVFSNGPGSATLTVTGANNVSNPLYVNVSETTVIVNLSNMTDAATMMITANYDQVTQRMPSEFITFGRTLGANETYTVVNFPAAASTNTMTVNIGDGISTIATGTVSNISIDPRHTNTITITPQRTH